MNARRSQVQGVSRSPVRVCGGGIGWRRSWRRWRRWGIVVIVPTIRIVVLDVTVVSSCVVDIVVLVNNPEPEDLLAFHHSGMVVVRLHQRLVISERRDLPISHCRISFHKYLGTKPRHVQLLPELLHIQREQSIFAAVVMPLLTKP